MEKRIAEHKAIDQASSTDELDETPKFECLGDFLDHVEMGVRAFVRVMLQQYAEDEFMRYIGAKPYERTPKRQDYRNGARKRTLESRFGLIDDLEIPLGRKAGISYSTILARYRRQDRRIEEIVSEMFLRGVSTRKIGTISRLLWGGKVSASEVRPVRKSRSSRVNTFSWIISSILLIFGPSIFPRTVITFFISG